MRHDARPLRPWPSADDAGADADTWQPAPGGGFTVFGSIGEGMELLKANYGMFLGASLLVTLAYMAVGMIPFIGGLAAIAILPFFASLTLMMVRKNRGEPVEWQLCFAGVGDKYGWLLLQQFLVMLAASAVIIVAMAPIMVLILLAGSGLGPGVLLVVVPIGIAAAVATWYIQARLMFAGVLYLDAPPGRLDAFQAFKLSWTLSGPVAWPLVGLILMLSLISFGTALLLCVGLFLLGIPLYFATLAVAYGAVCSGPASGICPACGYLCGTLDVCPECGNPAPPR